MIGAWSAFVRVISHREPGTSFALFRIGLGATVLQTLASTGGYGVVDALWIDKRFGGLGSRGEGTWLVQALGGPSPDVVWPLFWAAVGSALALTVGLGGRWAALATLLAFTGLTDLNSSAGGSYDDLIENGLWLLFLAGPTATLSVDARVWTGSFVSDRPVLAFGRYLAVFQLVLMYWTTGLQKVSTFWVPGGDASALYYILQQPTWQRFDLRWVAWLYPVTQIGTTVSWFWEVSAPLWLLAFWFRATRTRPGALRSWFNTLDVRLIYAGVGLVFHAALFVLMDVGPFSPASLAFYACLFSPDELAAFARRFRRPR